MCDYQRGTWECRGDGYLWDADSDGYDPEERDNACPNCNTVEFLVQAKEEAENTIEGTSMTAHYTGVSLWQGAVARALELDAAATRAALAALGSVKALQPASNEKGFEEVVFQYDADGMLAQPAATAG